jgi:chromosome segregation ATPase
MEANEKEKQYNKLKLSLEAMGYKGYLSEESVQLVNSVLSDLIKATKAFKNIMLEKNTLESKLRVQDDIIIPLRNENYKISKDNNELHKEIIRLKDALDLRNTSENTKVQTLQRSIDEIQFVVEQKNQLIQKYLTQNEILRNKLNTIFDTLYMGEGDRAIINEKGLEKARKIISNVNPESINTTFKKKAFEITENLYSNNTTSNNENNNEILDAIKQEMNNIKVSKEDWSNDLKKAETEMENNRGEIKNLRDELEEKNKILNQYQKVLEEREKEIKRLQEHIYYNDENKDELKLRYQSEFIKEENDKLQSQIEFLNKENHRLNAIDYFHSHRCREEEVKRLDAEIARLTKENEKLKKSLDNMGLGDLNSSIMTGNKSFMNRSRFSFYSSTNLSDQVKKLKADKKTLMQLLEKEKEKNQELTKELMVSKDENIEKLSNVNKEKENLQNKLEELQKQNSELKEQK